MGRAVRAVAVVYGGTLLALGAVLRLQMGPAAASAFWTALELVLGAVALQLLGRGAWRRSLAGAAAAGPCAVGIGVGVATFAFSWGFVAAVRGLLGIAVPDEPASLLTWINVVLVAPPLEEWLCRGVLWSALAPYSSPRVRVAATAVLFGLLHCSGGLLGFPHRFVAGLAFGWLRHRFDSLLPAMLAHVAHNVLALSV